MRGYLGVYPPRNLRRLLPSLLDSFFECDIGTREFRSLLGVVYPNDAGVCDIWVS